MLRENTLLFWKFILTLPGKALDSQLVQYAVLGKRGADICRIKQRVRSILVSTTIAGKEKKGPTHSTKEVVSLVPATAILLQSSRALRLGPAACFPFHMYCGVMYGTYLALRHIMVFIPSS